jgi:hypothetical protein
LLLEEGELDKLADSMIDLERTKTKNRYLMPLYMEITSIIKHFLNTDIRKIQHEFRTSLAELYRKYLVESEEFLKEKKELQSAYENLIRKPPEPELIF